MLPPPPRRRPPRPQLLSLGAFIIHGGWGSGIAQYIRQLQIGSFHLIILMNIKITDQASYHNRLRYDMVYSPEITTAASGPQEVVGLVVRDQPQGCSI